MRRSIMLFFMRSPVSSLMLMTVFFLGFGYFSFNLFFLLKANIDLIARHGTLALKEGAAQQVALILLSGFASTCSYTGIKYCERVLIDWLTDS